MRKFAITLLAGLLAVAVASSSTDTLRLDAAKAVELALQNNRQIALAQARLDEATAGKGAAFGAFLPQVSASGTYTRLGTVSEFTMYAAKESVFGLPVFDPTGQYIGKTIPIPVAVGMETLNLKLGSADNPSLTGTVQQTLFTWGKLLNAYRISGLNVDLQRAAADQARSQLRVDATSGFYQALLARKTVDVMNDALRQLRGHVGQVQSLYDNGMATKLDLMKATLGLQQMEAQVSQIENGAELTLAALLNTLGLDPGTPVSFTGDLAPDTMTVDLDQATKQALDKRPELLQLRDAARMAGLAVNISKTANLPTAFAQANGYYKDPVGFSPGWGTDWNATVGVSMPLFTGLSNVNKLKQAQARERQAKVGLALAEDGIRLDVQASVLSLNQETRNRAYQQKNVEVAQAALALAEQRFQNGLLTNLDYMDSELALTQARVAYLNALANYQIAKARLQKAVGEY
ncbi:MAG TPA: TolC family protein [bacterium]|nr:TolC family protein [bacterium]